MTIPSEDQLHPIAQQYLRDLQSSLQYSEPAEAQDTINAVAEHLSAALSPQSSDAQVHEVLAALGPVESIVRESTPALGQGTQGPYPTDPEHSSSGFNHGGLALTLTLISLALVIFLPQIALLLGAGSLGYSLVAVKRSGGAASAKWAVAIAALAVCAVLLLLWVGLDVE